ncbi:MAG: hypothetical protein GTO74_09675, partial [Hydrogenophaga sp.]|uniref:hypothetical protein n=1 Tax=Hydrogenophaga sp. TaxID=1904254 RepID=UPI0016AC7F10
DPVHLFQVLQGRRDLKAVVLAILGGAEGMDGRRRGGFWCEDTFSEIANLRHLHLAWGPRGVLFIGVLCPPVH